MLNYSIGDGYSALDAQAWRDKLDGFAVVSGLSVSPGTGLEVVVDTGTALVGETNGTPDTASLGSTTSLALDTADPDNPRKVTIWIDDTATVGKTEGDAEPANPSDSIRFNTFEPEPAIPTGDVTILAEVWVAAGASSLATADIRDRRVPADVVADDLASRTVTANTATADEVVFDPALRDTGRFEMIHLNTFNVGGDAKQAEVNLTISDYTSKDINKILLYCEHISVYTSSGGNQTFAVQINGQSGTGAYENMRVDGSTTANDHAIIAKGAANTEPMMGHVWFHADQDFMVYPEGAPRAAGIDGTIHRAAVDNAQSSTPWTIDSLRFYTPDGDEVRMRRATVFGFTEGAN